MVEWNSTLLAFASHLHSFSAASLLVVLRTLLSSSNCHVELCDFVGILTRSWNFDRACPVKVEVTECESQVLDVNFRKIRIVLRHKEMRRKNTTLVR